MPSIDEKRIARLQRFYRLHVLPLTGQARFEHPEGWKTDENSYFLRRIKNELGPEDFEWRMGTPREIATTLDEFWSGSRLEGLGSKLVALSRRFADVQHDAEVSQYIYEMF